MKASTSARIFRLRIAFLYWGSAAFGLVCTWFMFYAIGVGLKSLFM